MLSGWSIIIVGGLLIILGIVLRWDLIDWLIDFAGLILIIVGIVAVVIGILTAIRGGGKGRSDEW